MANSSNLTVSVGADTSKLRAELAAAQADVRKFAQELRVAAQAARETGDTTQVNAAAERYEAAAGRVRNFARQIRAAAQEHHQFAGANAAVTQSFAAFEGRLGQVSTAVAGLGGQLINFRTIATLSLGAIGAAFFKLTSDAAKASDDLQDTAEAIGISVDKVLAFQLAASREGADPEAAIQTLTRFSRALGTAWTEADKAAGVLGGNLLVLNGRAQAMGTGVDVARGTVAKLGDEAKKTAASFEAVGGAFGQTVNIVRGGVQPILDTSSVFATLGIRIQDFPRTQQGFLDAIEQTSAAIDRLGQGAQKASILSQLFGRNWARQVELFTNLKERLKEAEAILSVMKLSPDPAEQQRTKDYLSSLATLTTVFTRVKTVLGTIVGTALVPLFKGLTTVLSANQQQLINWAQSTASFFIPIMEDVVRLLHDGFGGQFQTQTVTQLVQVLQALASVGRVVSSVFRGLISVLDLAAAAFNRIFGTEFTGTGLLVIAILLRLTGVLRLLGTVAAGTLAAFRLFIPISGIFTRLASLGAWGILLRLLGPAGLIATGLLFLIDKFKLLGGAATDAGNKATDTAQKAVQAATVIRGATDRAGQTGERLTSPEGTAAVRPGERPIGRTVREIPIGGFDPSQRGPLQAARVTIDASTVEIKTDAELGRTTAPTDVSQQTPIGDFIKALTGQALTPEQMFGPAQAPPEQFGPPVPSPTEQLTENVKADIDTIKQLWTDLSAFVMKTTESITGTIQGWLDAISNTWSRFLSSLQSIVTSQPSQGFAAGGFIRGPGSGTSDSIFARLSNGEFVMRAAAVRRLGVDFLEGLNNFASGGLVGMPPIRFAAGGLVSAASPGRPVHLHLGGESFALSGSESVVDALVGAAYRQQVRSAGVKPTWFGGRPSGR
jgi:hypothetical protein